MYVYCVAHSCHYPGCGTVIVLDGNMKNRRNICAATEAGYTKYAHLPGSIKTGCQLSPLASSKYCYYHAPRASAGLYLQKPEIPSDVETPTDEGIIQFILGKKTTRSQIYYQV